MGPGWLNLARNASAHGIRVHPIVSWRLHGRKYAASSEIRIDALF